MNFRVSYTLHGVIATAVLGMTGCQGRNDALTIKEAGLLRVFEGLPHPLYEGTVLEAEKGTKPTVEFGGEPFYRDPLDISDADVATLVAILGDRSTYESFSVEKKCGGFHSDYSIEWTHTGAIYRALVCFGCGEIKVIGPAGEARFDMAGGGDVWRRLGAILRPYRKNRPRPPKGSFLDRSEN